MEAKRKLSDDTPTAVQPPAAAPSGKTLSKKNADILSTITKNLLSDETFVLSFLEVENPQGFMLEWMFWKSSSCSLVAIFKSKETNYQMLAVLLCFLAKTIHCLFRKN